MRGSGMSSSGHSLVGSQSRSDGQPCLNETATSLNQRSTRASLIVSRYIEKSPGSATSISRTVRGPAGVACDSHVCLTMCGETMDSPPEVLTMLTSPGAASVGIAAVATIGRHERVGIDQEKDLQDMLVVWIDHLHKIDAGDPRRRGLLA